MKATGIIVEYNPFHNGHKFHATEAKKATNADLIIAVMSGNFLQRGEPAFVDKWTRTKMALSNGIDLVFELPYAFATAHAPQFSQGAIIMLDALQCAHFCFGSEEGSIQPFQNSHRLLTNVHEDYEQAIKEAMSRGLSYPKALNVAYQMAIKQADQTQLYADLTKPNNILGYHYIQVAHHIKTPMQAATIQRIGAGYHEDAMPGNSIASATGIRKNYFATQNLKEIRSYSPQATHERLMHWQASQASFGSWESFYPLLRFTILREGPERLSGIADITEGIENLFYTAATSNDTFAGFMKDVKSKRYTWTRLQRMLTHIFTGFTYDMRKEIEAPSYLRLLGMTQTGRTYLNEHKKQFTLPLVSKAAAFSDSSLTLDIHAANLYALGISRGNETPLMGADYTTSPIYVK